MDYEYIGRWPEGFSWLELMGFSRLFLTQFSFFLKKKTLCTHFPSVSCCIYWLTIEQLLWAAVSLLCTQWMKGASRWEVIAADALLSVILNTIYRKEKRKEKPMEFFYFYSSSFNACTQSMNIRKESIPAPVCLAKRHGFFFSLPNIRYNTLK
jgi:hypothetical protein